MGEGHVSATGTAALIALAALAPAQGPVYRESWSDLQRELLRERVQIESRGRDRATLQAVADLLAAPGQGEAYRPAARALARLRGVDCDDLFLLRAALGAFVLPEVVDPEASREDCRDLHVSLQLPFVLPLPVNLSFVVEVVDGAGARVHRAEFGSDADLESLRMARTSVAVPTQGLADGRYRVRIGLLVDGKEPHDGGRDADPRLEHVFRVLRGYEGRATKVRESWHAAATASDPATRALIRGMAARVDRAFEGEAFDGESNAVAELERAERVLQNVADGKPPLDGLSGAVAIGLPTGGERVLDAVVTLTPVKTSRRPLVVVCGGAPALDVEGHRPLAPTVRSAEWVHRRVGDLGLGDRACVAWLQSPCAEFQYSAALPSALAALRAMLPVDDRTVFVLEFEAAVALAYSPDVLQQQATAAVFVGAGALAGATLQRLADLPMLGVPLSGHRSGDGLRFTAEQAKRLDGKSRFELAPDVPRPWTFGAAAAKAEIAAFVARLPAGR